MLGRQSKVLVAIAFFAGLSPAMLSPSSETPGCRTNRIDVTGLIGSGVSVLYVIDTESQQLVAYDATGGGELRFVAARRIRYDVELRKFRRALDAGRASEQ